ncbi:MAG: magnesium transporter, partial [Pseudomonadota bacterium]
ADAEDKELIAPESRMMLEGVIRMADMTAGDVMVAAPRMDLIDLSAHIDDTLHQVIETKHSRFPVFENESDRAPMGIALYKDLLTNNIYAFVGRKTGPKTNYIFQYLLKYDENGMVKGELVRKLGKFSGKKEIESNRGNESKPTYDAPSSMMPENDLPF